MAVKMFRDAWDQLSSTLDRTGDISLAAYILQHCLQGDNRSVASIGMASESEFNLLHALAEPGTNFVYLNVDHRNEVRQHLTGMTNHLEAEGFGSRAIISDLMLPGRWASLLGALALGEVGVLGVSARWANTDSQFWKTLASFLHATERAVYIRGLLDYRHPRVALALLRGMPADQELEVVASTRGAVWLAAGPFALRVREALKDSGLFGASAEVGPGLPPVVQADVDPTLIDQRGRLPALLYRICKGGKEGLEFGPGWSGQEADGCWTDSAQTQVSFTFKSGLAPATLVIEGNPWMPPDAEQQMVDIAVGKSPRNWTTLSFWHDEISRLTLPLTPADYAGNRIVVNVRVQSPGRPSDHGGEDHRLLGFKLRLLAVYT